MTLLHEFISQLMPDIICTINRNINGCNFVLFFFFWSERQTTTVYMCAVCTACNMADPIFSFSIVHFRSN